MRTFMAALIAATILVFAAPASAQEDVPVECPSGTMQGDTSLDGGPLYCVCVTDSTAVIYERGEDGSGEQIAPVESCPAERAPEPAEDCADAPGCVLPASISRPESITAPTPDAASATATAPAAQVASVSPAFTG